MTWDSQTVRNEQPAGTPDGPVFTVKHIPIAWSVQLYKNGLRQFPGIHFTEVRGTKQIKFLAAAIPQAGDLLLADYDYLP